jgi:hypothetical protein
MPADATIRDAWAIAEAVYVRAYPLVLGRRAMAQATAVAAPEPETLRAPVNTLVHGWDTPDTLRSSAWIDLASEPLVLTVPDTGGRYYALWLRDAWGDVFESIGARTTGTRRGAFALLGPCHHAVRLPENLTPIAVATRTMHLGGRLEAVGEPAGAAVRTAHDGFRLVPLSHVHGSGNSPPAPETAADTSLATRPAVTATAIDGLDAPAFFGEVLRLAQEEPPDLEGRVLLGRLRELLAREPLSPELVASLARGIERGRAAVVANARLGPQPTRSGWEVHPAAGVRRVDCLSRAAAAHAGRASEPAADVMLAYLDRDEDGHLLSGADSYVLRFAPDTPPPAYGFWELTTWGGTPARARSTGDLHGLMLDQDGSLSVHLQRTPPERAQRSNWLPTPAGSFALTLRLYWPSEEALEPAWSPPPLQRLS